MKLLGEVMRYLFMVFMFFVTLFVVYFSRFINWFISYLYRIVHYIGGLFGRSYDGRCGMDNRVEIRKASF